MTEVSIDQTVNITPIGRNLNVGVIDAPDSHPKVILYDAKKATKEIRQINNDVYEAQRNASPTKHRKTPKGFWFLLSAAVLTGIVLFFKHFVKK
ncbi:hypothetical protein J6S88_07245 [bacterium]|nr:hypothetical protein [bacterium]